MPFDRVLAAGLLAGTGALTALLAAFGWRHRAEIGADWFAATMAGNTVWVGTTIAGLFAGSRATLLAVEYLGTAAATVVPPLWFCFVLAYTGREHLLHGRGLALVWSVPAVVIAGLLTSPLHGLYYADLAVVAGPDGLDVVAPPGPLAWVNLAFFGALVVVGLGLVADVLGESDGLYAGQAVWLLVGALAPVAILVGRLATGAEGWFPPIPLGFSVLGLAYADGLFNHRLLDLSPASRRIGLPEAFDDLGEGVVLVDADRDVVAINDRACELFECRKETVLGASLEAVSAPLASIDVPADGADGPTDGVDLRTDGRTLSVSVSPVRDARERLTGYALVVRDVTADRRREQRLAVLDRVFRHNIRNTMNAVVGPTATLADRLDGPEGSAAETARDAARDVLALSESVHDVERIMTGAVDPTTVRVDDAVERAVASVREGTDTAFTAEVSVPPGLTLDTDPSVLALVLEHVVENAVEHSSTSPSPTRPTVEIDVEPRDRGCFVHVTDEGPGVPAAELRALRADAETPLAHGTGVGLRAIHWGVTRLDGAVRFRNLDAGARVTLWFPSLDDAGTNTIAAEPNGRDTETDTPGTPGTGPTDGDAPTDEWLGADPPESAGRPDDE